MKLISRFSFFFGWGLTGRFASGPGAADGESSRLRVDVPDSSVAATVASTVGVGSGSGSGSGTGRGVCALFELCFGSLCRTQTKKPPVFWSWGNNLRLSNCQFCHE